MTVLKLSALALGLAITTAHADPMTPPATSGEQRLARAADAERFGTSLAATQPGREDGGATMGRLETVEDVPGSEPDPERFDRAGLEKWWHDYQAKLARAE
jgi:hypothetical protein